MKLKEPLKKVHQLFNIIQDLEILYGLEIELKIVKPKVYYGKGIVESLIDAQQGANKIIKLTK